ncbi:MAG TPA: hypothetical protein DHV48_20555 [Prolixibacteraceae bacterium]|nr:hypothetical protein [Prolixibacteraceae bacterium]
MERKLIGRDASCDYVIFDTKNRVSRRHAELYRDHNQYYIKDLGSKNGTYVNGNRIIPENLVQIVLTDKVTLSTDYHFDPKSIFGSDDDETKILPSNISLSSAGFENNQAVYKDNQRTVVFDRDKTRMEDLLQMDNSPFLTIGRNTDNRVVISNNNISKYHCRIRLLTPVMIEVEDLGSTNGTYADEEKLKPNVRSQYSSSVKIRLGSSFILDLKKFFPNIQIIPKNLPLKPEHQQTPSNPNESLTRKEIAAFYELEAVWKEYVGRQNQANNFIAGYGIGGAVLGIAAVAFTGGAGAIFLMSGGGILGRYLGQQKSNKIRNDLTYEDAFLQIYACPRCGESFQKKPWITIRECYKCKAKFR